MYIPICFAYILPASRYGWFGGSITPQQLNPPKRPFCVMGFLDCLAASMQVFSSVYLPGTLLVLLPQAAIPCSMLFSRYLLAERYCWMQYCGAAIVLVGILVVLEPVISLRHSPDYYCEAINMENDCTICRVESNKDSCLSHLQNDDAATDAFTMYTNSAYELADPDASATVGGLCQWLPFDEAAKDDEFLIIVWSLVMIASCVPMTLSTVSDYLYYCMARAAAVVRELLCNRSCLTLSCFLYCSNRSINRLLWATAPSSTPSFSTDGSPSFSSSFRWLSPFPPACLPRRQ